MLTDYAMIHYATDLLGARRSSGSAAWGAESLRLSGNFRVL